MCLKHWWLQAAPLFNCQHFLDAWEQSCFLSSGPCGRRLLCWEGLPSWDKGLSLQKGHRRPAYLTQIGGVGQWGHWSQQQSNQRERDGQRRGARGWGCHCAGVREVDSVNSNSKHSRLFFLPTLYPFSHPHISALPSFGEWRERRGSLIRQELAETRVKGCSGGEALLVWPAGNPGSPCRREARGAPAAVCGARSGPPKAALPVGPASGGLDHCLTAEETASEGGIIDHWGMWATSDGLFVECFLCGRHCLCPSLPSFQKRKLESILSQRILLVLS